MRRALFCLGCGKLGSGEVPPPDPYRPDGITVDGTPMPGWCDAPACQEHRARFEATCERIMREVNA